MARLINNAPAIMSPYIDNGFAFPESESKPIVEWIDLGLSVKWNRKNIGASSITDYGNYYAWGESEGKDNYSWSTYKFGDPNDGGLTKYTSDDHLTTLEADDDIATVTYGEGHRMPTKEEIEELIALPNKWTSVNGVNGRIFVREDQSGVVAGDFSIVDDPGLYFYDASQDFSMGVSDYLSADALQYVNSIEDLNKILTDTFRYQEGYEGTANASTMLFKDENHTELAVAGIDYTFGQFPAFDDNTMLFIPAAGYWPYTEVYDVGYSCGLWSSSLLSDDPLSAWYLGFLTNEVDVSNDLRYCGCSARSVLSENKE